MISPQDNREKGENPLRSRRCKCGAQFYTSLGNWEEELLLGCISQKTCLSFRCAPVTSDDRCGGFFVVQMIPLERLSDEWESSDVRCLFYWKENNK